MSYKSESVFTEFVRLLLECPRSCRNFVGATLAAHKIAVAIKPLVK
jgi:hypothetical protein